MKKSSKLKKFAVIVGILVIAGIGLYALWASWENWTGARAWDEVRTMLEDNDVKLELSELVPEPVPAADNFCSTPLIASLLEYQWKRPSSLSEPINDSTDVIYENPELHERVLEIALPDPAEGESNAQGFPNWQSASQADLKPILLRIQKESAATSSVLDWMAQFDSELAEMDAAAQRPSAQIAIPFAENFIAYIGMPLPYLSELQDLQKFQLIRACAALEAGDTEQARTALRNMFQLTRMAISNQTLIGFLVALTLMDTCLSVVWQGIDAGVWSSDDLKWIQDRLVQESFIDQLAQALNFELVMMQIGAPDFLKSVPTSDSKLLMSLVGLDEESGKGVAARPMFLLVPNGIWDHNKAFGCRVAFEQGILPVRERRIPDQDALKAEWRKRSPRTFLASMMIPAISRITENGLFMSVAIELARTACAIERHHLEHGDYPDKLDSLVPSYLDKLPEDILAPGKPLSYGKGLHGDRYRIYSVGKNLSDDGGEVFFKNSSRGAPRRDLERGDWAWGYAFDYRSPQLE